MAIYISWDQSISINWLILIVDDQSMAKFHVVINWYWLVSIFNTKRYIGCYHLVADGKKRNRQIKNPTLYAVIVNTFHFNFNMRTILFFLFNVHMNPFFFLSFFLFFFDKIIKSLHFSEYTKCSLTSPSSLQ